jgi:hypothetical protein
MPVPAADFILIGTGLAPLIAAQRLLAEGADVVLVNPESAPFAENAELPLAPFLLLGPGTPERGRLAAPGDALDQLRPIFPGAVEFEPMGSAPGTGFSDPLAPRLRSRDHFFLFSSGGEGPEKGMDAEAWEGIAKSAGLHPRRLDELTARLRIPGLSQSRRQGWLASEEWDPTGALQVARLCDLDLERFRRGILDFVQERLGPERFLAGTGMPDCVGPHTVRLSRGGPFETLQAGVAVIVFSSASTLPWQLKQSGAPEALASRLVGRPQRWEHWTLLSKEDLDPGVVIHLGKHAVIYAGIEGVSTLPEAGSSPRSRLLRVLRRTKQEDGRMPSPVSERSIQGLASLCTQDLGWERFSIRSLRTGISHLPIAGTPTLVRELPGFTGQLNFWTMPATGGPVVEVAASVSRVVDVLLGAPPGRAKGEIHESP